MGQCARKFNDDHVIYIGNLSSRQEVPIKPSASMESPIAYDPNGLALLQVRNDWEDLNSRTVSTPLAAQATLRA